MTDSEVKETRPAPGDMVRVDWPGEPHPAGRLARLVRYTRDGRPVVRLYYFGRGADRRVDGPIVPASLRDYDLADAMDDVLEVPGAAGPAVGPRSRR
jgi:hypothetical protein